VRFIVSRIGTVRHVRRYPVKSMMGEDLDVAELVDYGIAGDRIYAFINEKSPDKSFSWMTARQANELLLYKPHLTSDAELEIEAPEGKSFVLSEGTMGDFLEEKYGYPLTMRYDKTGCKDAKPISLIGMQSVESLSMETGLKLAHERFRANIYADWDNRKPYFEDELVGKTLQIGQSASIRIVKKDTRCVIPTLDPKTSESSPIVLQKIQKNHGGYIGVYAVVEKIGPLRVGDEIFLS
jgi:uncharacterized protein YcbX